MTRFISFFVSVFMFIFSWLIPGDKTFEYDTIKIDGVTYQNGFVADNMHLKDEFNLHEEKAIHSEYVFTLTGGYSNYYYQITDNLIFKNSDTSWGANIKENLFCPIDEWDNLFSYYQNEDNYNYYYEVQIDNGYFTKYDVQNADAAKFDEIIQFSVDNEYGSTNENKAKTISLTDTLTPVVRFYKESNDGLLVTNTMRFIVYEGNLYFHRYTRAGTMQVSVLPNELETYFISLLKSAGLEEYF